MSTGKWKVPGIKPPKLNPKLVRSEVEIREDLAKQLAIIHQRWQRFACL